MLVVPIAVLTSLPTYLPIDLRNLRRGQTRDGAALKISPIRSTSAFIVTATCYPYFFFPPGFERGGLQLARRKKICISISLVLSVISESIEVCERGSRVKTRIMNRRYCPRDSISAVSFKRKSLVTAILSFIILLDAIIFSSFPIRLRDNRFNKRIMEERMR